MSWIRLETEVPFLPRFCFCITLPVDRMLILNIYVHILEKTAVTYVYLNIF